MINKERQISERSLENLKLGAPSRDRGKVRHNFTLMPETVEWLKKGGNASDRIDQLVFLAKNKDLLPSNTHHGKDQAIDSINTHEQKEQVNIVSINVYEREMQDLKRDLEETQLELQKTRSLLDASRQKERDVTDQLSGCHSDAFKAADILKAALELKANNGSKIKVEIKKALELIDDV